MFCLRTTTGRRVSARRLVRPPLRARVWVEELESRNLLATSPLGAPLSAPLSGPGPTFSPALVQSNTPGTGQPAGSETTPAGAGSTSGLNAGNTASGPAGQSQPSALIPGTLPFNAGQGFNGPATGFLTPVRFPALATGAWLAAPGMAPTGVTGATMSPVNVAVLTFLGLPGQVGLPLARNDFALLPTGPGTIQTNFYTGGPAYFDMVTHGLLGPVGGPNPRSAEDYREGFEDGEVFPGPNAPRLSLLERAPQLAPEAQQAAPPADLNWSEPTAWPLLSEGYFAEENALEEPVPTELIGRTSVGLSAAKMAPLVEREEAEPQAGPLPAVAALGLLGGPSWRKEERRRDGSPLAA